jgi:AbrB family looped-hinge helix DNA binding protein
MRFLKEPVSLETHEQSVKRDCNLFRILIFRIQKYIERRNVQTARSVTAEIKSRGQLTIPKKIRVMSRLEEGQIVSIIPVGDSVIITPKRLELEDARREIRRIMKEAGISPEDLLAGLQEEREKLFEETYGTKSR